MRTTLLVGIALGLLAFAVIGCSGESGESEDLITPTEPVSTSVTSTSAPIATETPEPTEAFTATIVVPPTDPPLPTSTPQVTSLWDQNGDGCHDSYVGACLDPAASDYDCAGGSGNGPLYTGPVQVVGPDTFDLDRDHDGYGCE